jgi:hypothetical protein
VGRGAGPPRDGDDLPALIASSSADRRHEGVNRPSQPV